MYKTADKTKLIYTELGGAAVCLILSFLLHFIYEWLWSSPYIAWLGANNESVWEHGKLLFYPYLIYSVIEYRLLKPVNTDAYLTAKCIPLILMIPLMITIYYTYSGILGTHILWCDILITIIIIILSFIYSYVSYDTRYQINHPRIAAALVLLILTLIIIFSYYPPQIALFIPSTH